MGTRTRRESRTQRMSTIARRYLAILCAALIHFTLMPSASSAPSASSSPTAATAPSAAANGSIRGRVELRRPPSLVDRRPNVADLGAGGRRDLSDRMRSVVYLE